MRDPLVVGKVIVEGYCPLANEIVQRIEIGKDPGSSANSGHEQLIFGWDPHDIDEYPGDNVPSG
jgi:hypothetical protein